jgi:protein ImuB
MAFASIHIPDFWVQAVARFEPALRGRGVALVDGIPSQSKIVAANPEALSCGIQLGISKALAMKFEGVEIRHRSPGKEASSHAALLDLGWSFSPRVEDAAPDTMVLDLAGLASLFGCEEIIAARLTQGAADLGLAANVSITGNLEAALLASRGFPGIMKIPTGQESRCLGSLPVHFLSASPEILETLERWGIRDCAALAALPLLDLSERLGQPGVRLHELARGAYVRALVLAEPSHSFEEEMQLEDTVEELEPLSFVLGRLLDQLCARLEARALAANSIRVRFELDAAVQAEQAEETRRNSFASRARTQSQPQRQKNAAQNGDPDAASAGDAKAGSRLEKIYEKTLTLPLPMRDSKMLLKLLRLQLQSDPPDAPIQKVMLAAEPANPRATQGGLFLPSYPDPEKLELTVARLATLVGDANIGSPEIVDTHRPGAFRIRRFIPPGDASEKAIPSRPPQRRPAIGFRTFRPAPPARIELLHNRPVRASFLGMRGDVVAASGPWRTSGDWWREDAWKQEEWDLEILLESASSNSGGGFKNSRERARDRIQRRGIYCFFFDSIRQSWFVRGTYD